MSDYTHLRTGQEAFDMRRLLETLWGDRVEEGVIDVWIATHDLEHPECRSTWLYVMQAMPNDEEPGGPVKIGISDKVEDRIAAVQTHCPYPVWLVLAVRACRHVERILHDWFAEYRTFGEWFRPEGIVLDTVRALELLEEDEMDEAIFGVVL